MSGGGHPKDNSVQLQREKQAHDDQVKAQADAAAAAEKTRLGGLASTARSNAGTSADAYFNEQGVDPSSYEGVISNIINSIAVPEGDVNPAGYYKGVGQQAYDTATSSARSKASGGLDKLFDPNYEYTRVPDTLDDPFLASIDAEQRQTAEGFLNNLKARGVITEGGYGAAEKDLDRQNAGVMAKLNELGTGALATGRQGISDVINRGRSAASGLKLGTAFDPNAYKTQVDSAFNDFLNNLGTTLRGKVTGNLFDTSSLPVIAGAAQGAGNAQTYDPKALAGIFENTDDQNTDQTNRTNTSTGVF